MNRALLKTLAVALLIAWPLLDLKVNRYEAQARVDPEIQSKIVEFLKNNGFAVDLAVMNKSRILIRAHLDSCAIEIHEVAEQGYDRAAIQAIAGTRRLFYLYKGMAFRHQPAWRTWSYFHLRRFVVFLGMRLPKKATMAVISSDACPDFTQNASFVRLDGKM